MLWVCENKDCGRYFWNQTGLCPYCNKQTYGTSDAYLQKTYVCKKCKKKFKNGSGICPYCKTYN